MEFIDIAKDVYSGTLTLVATSWARGYVSRKIDSTAEPYKGRYGEGYKVHYPSWSSTQYHRVSYYVKQEVTA